MKTQRYHLEKVIEGATCNNTDYIKDELKDVLESNKEYTRKADYIGYSILSLDDKVKFINEQIDELKEYKLKLQEAKALVLEVGAKVFQEYGICKLEGAGISSITVTKESTSSRTSILIKNEQALIEAGFRKIVLDEQAVINAYNDGLYQEIILANASINTSVNITTSKLKINKRRTPQKENLKKVA